LSASVGSTDVSSCRSVGRGEPGRRRGQPRRLPQIRTCPIKVSGSSRRGLTCAALPVVVSWTADRGSMPRAVARPQPRDEAPPSLPGSSRHEFPGVSGTTERSDSRPSLPCHFVAFARRLPPPCACVRGSTQARRRLGARGVRVRPPPEPVVIEAETVGRPKFLGNPDSRLPCSLDAGRTAGTRPLRCRGVAPGM
jgi:hypothetical protein